MANGKAMASLLHQPFPQYNFLVLVLTDPFGWIPALPFNPHPRRRRIRTISRPCLWGAGSPSKICLLASPRTNFRAVPLPAARPELSKKARGRPTTRESHGGHCSGTLAPSPNPVLKQGRAISCSPRIKSPL
ncbi:hypothetical protein LX36DRAFT_223119 [Colletotrichum falcatum]|nr:hypothetical protein LX36DRAFT_223119 [Colletotrichum falcatum]